MEKLITVLCCSLISSSTSQDALSNLIPSYGEDLLPSYSDSLSSYGQEDVAASAAASAPMSGIDMLRMSVPGNPGQDYPIYAEIPETSFTCDGRVEGGYYADVEAECQPFHVCSVDSNTGGLVKFSFLCPNGTLFNQEHFVCEYWFNVDCSSAESFFNLNDNIGDVPVNSLAADASSPVSGYAPPASAPSGSYSQPASAPSNSYSSSASTTNEYSAPSDTSLPDYDAQPALPQYSSSQRTGRFRKGKSNRNKINKRPVSSIKPLTNSRPFTQFNRRGKSSNEERTSSLQTTLSPNSRPTTPSRLNSRPTTPSRINSRPPTTPRTISRPTRTTSRPNPRPLPFNNKLNEVNVNRNKSKPRGIKNKKKLKSFNKSQVKSKSKLSPPPINTFVNNKQNLPSLISVTTTETRRGKKVGNERRKGRQELTTGYLPPTPQDESGSDSLSNYDEYEYEYQEAPLPTYNSASSSAADASYAAPAENSLPTDDSYSPPVESEDSYGAPLTDNAPTAVASDSSYESPSDSSYSEPDNSGPYAAPASDFSQNSDSYASPASDFSQNSDSYTVPASDYSQNYDYSESAYDEAADIASEVYEEDVLPTYNNGVYNQGSVSGSPYTAPVAPSIPADSPLNDEDVLPSYNNGVYNSGDGGDDYVAPAPGNNYQEPVINNSFNSPSSSASSSSYSSPTSGSSSSYESPDSSSSSYSSPSSSSFNPPTSATSNTYGSPRLSPSSFQPITNTNSYSAPSSANTFEEAIPGSYNDDGADILPEYHKSEISLGLNNRNEVPRIEPFSNDFGEPLYIGTYTASGSAVKQAVVRAPSPAPSLDTGYGVPSAPTLSDYNIPDISDIGYKSSGGSSYGR